MGSAFFGGAGVWQSIPEGGRLEEFASWLRIVSGLLKTGLKVWSFGSD
jgi:hypothetical protein